MSDPKPIYFLAMARDGLNVTGQVIVRTGPYFRQDMAARRQRVSEFLLQLREIGLTVTAKPHEDIPR